MRRKVNICSKDFSDKAFSILLYLKVRILASCSASATSTVGKGYSMEICRTKKRRKSYSRIFNGTMRVNTEDERSALEEV